MATHSPEPRPTPETPGEPTPNPTRLPVEPEFGPMLPPAEPEDPFAKPPSL